MILRVCRVFPIAARYILVSHANRKPTKRTVSDLITLSSNFNSISIVLARSFSSKFDMEAADPRRVLSYDDVLDVIKKPNSRFLIDVRELDEVKATGQIPTSVHIPLGNVERILTLSDEDFEKQTNRKKPSKESEVVFYCQIGRRSERAVSMALQLGFKNSKNYLGSWSEWTNKQNQ